MSKTLAAIVIALSLVACVDQTVAPSPHGGALGQIEAECGPAPYLTAPDAYYRGPLSSQDPHGVACYLFNVNFDFMAEALPYERDWLGCAAFVGLHDDDGSN